MDWEAYRKIYASYLTSVGQTRILSLAAADVLKDFPASLPSELARPLEADFAKLHELEEKILSAMRKREPISLSIDAESAFLSPMLKILSAHVMLHPQAPLELDFQKLLLSQELVMVFAHLDAFMDDSLCTICQMRPEVLRSDKNIVVKKLFALGGWEGFLNYLTKKYVFEFSRKSITSRVNSVRELGLALAELESSDIELLEEAEKDRHDVVHNGGRVNQDYIARTQRTDLMIGEPLPLTREYLDSMSSVAERLARNLFVEVSREFFHEEDPLVARG